MFNYLHGKSATTAFVLLQSPIHREYCFYFQELFRKEDIYATVAEYKSYNNRDKFGGKIWYKTVVMRSKALTCLNSLRVIFYPHAELVGDNICCHYYNVGKKAFPDFPLSPVTLLHLYLGDGSLTKYNGRSIRITLNTCDFSIKENKVFATRLASTLNVPRKEVRIGFTNGKFKGYPQICLRKKVSLKLLDYIPNPNLECFKHKFC
ncbi:MAG: hypothetical protein ACFFCQ_03165 [Promethearchaeota archaeon]